MTGGREMDRIYGSHREEWSGDKTLEQPSGIWGRQPMLKYLGEKIIKPGDTVIDLGSGGGGPTAELAEMVGETGNVTGVEISKAQLGIEEDQENQTPLSQKYKQIHNLSFVNADISKIPIRSESVNEVVSFMVLHDLEMPDIEKAMHEIARILRPEGRAVILTMHPELFDSEEWNVPFWDYDKGKINAYQAGQEKEGFKIPGKIKGIDGREKMVEVITHTKDNYLQAIKSAGLEIVDGQDIYIDEATAKEKFGTDLPIKVPTKPAYWMITLGRSKS